MVDRPLEPDLVDAQPRRGIALGVEINEEGPPLCQSESRGQIHGGSRLATPPFWFATAMILPKKSPGLFHVKRRSPCSTWNNIEGADENQSPFVAMKKVLDIPILGKSAFFHADLPFHTIFDGVAPITGGPEARRLPPGLK